MSGAASEGRGTLVAVAAAVALMLGRLVLWLLVQLLKFLILLVIVGAILAIGFEVGSNWDGMSAAAPVAGTHHG
ncbi:MAG TPA: hypothetical protein VLM05_18820 [Mycobacteriales bacterium]|nr:hypothetical protein [Mycobacteriales bacterium]